VKKLIKFIIFSFAALCLILIVIGGVLYYFWSSNLPYIGSLKDYNPPIITEVYSDDGQVIGKYYDEKRIVVELEQVSKDLLNAIIAAEDDQFYKHEGIDYPGIIRSFIKNFMAGRITGSGSTITQQMTRTVLLKDMSQTYKRKTREIILSLQIEKMFSKERILFLFINEVYLGHGAYGVEAASQTYFGKKAKDLNLAECALIAGLYPAPSRYDPIYHLERAKVRQKYALRKMVKVGYITETQREEALNTPLVFGEKTDNGIMDGQHFTEYIRRYLEKQYGRDLLYRGGLKVYTTVNMDMQQWARDALSKGLRELDKREGYRGPIRSLTAEEMEKFSQETEEKLRLNPPEIGSVVQGVVDSVDDENIRAIITIGRESGILPLSEMKWARKPNPEVEYYAATVRRQGDVLKRGDVILCRIKEKMAPPYSWRVSLEQEPLVEGSVFVMEAKTGKVKAMIGGRDFTVSQFNRAIQSRRQPGSSFKPIIYSAALDSGMTPSTVILDTPYVSTMNPDEEVWRPKNYKENFLGPTLFRTGLIQSLNVITVKILKSVGVGNVIDYARRMGIESDLAPNLSLALGSSGLSLEEITTAYSVFANGGLLVEPFFIERIEDRTGIILEENQSSYREAISIDTAYVMTDLLKGVVTEGTGWRIKALKRPAAGKTGTTNDLRDAWFIGYTPRLVTGVWVGYDDRRPMSKGETGSRAASPIWLYFMSRALEGRPVEDFIAPEGVVFSKIDTKEGLLASSYSEKTVFQAFKKGTEPREYTPRPGTAKSGQFPQFDMDFGE
jgi:penicillin-binding protein 1A